MGSLLVESHDAVTVLTLNRPDSLNALTSDMVEALQTELSTAGRDRSCRAIVLTGAGERAFCAGIDVKDIQRRDAEAARSTNPTDPISSQFEHLHNELGRIPRLIHSLPIPVIAALNGHAIGAGFAFASACDLRIAGEGARFANGFISRGISGCELGLSYFLPRIVGVARAFDWMSTGRRVDAEEAERAGLVSAVVPAAETLPRAIALGAAIAQNAPFAVSMTKEVMWQNATAASLDHAMALESRTQIMARQTADAAEARAAFLEKRAPQFAVPETPRKLK